MHNSIHCLMCRSALWVGIACVLLPLAGCPGPEATECSACDQIYCLGDQVVTCDCYDDYPNGGFGRRLQVIDDCATSDTTCTVTVQGKGSESHTTGYVQGQAACLDTCTSPGAAECRVQSDQSFWIVCATPDAPAADLKDAALAWIQSAGSSATAPETGKAYGWQDTGLACVPCQSDCGCANGTLCQQGFCVPGQAPSDLVCCGRERNTDCPNNAACTQPDGTQSTCQTVGRCEPCEADINCETGVCTTVAPGLEPVCLLASEFRTRTLACHDAAEVWFKDACDRWVDPYLLCGAGSHCEGEACATDAPEVEVSPTLLPFGDVVVGQTKTLTLSIGNLGTAPLSVDEIAIDPAFTTIFSASPSQIASVAVNEIASVTVTFTPSAAGAVSARLYVRSNDGDEAEIPVLMNGAGVAP